MRYAYHQSKKYKIQLNEKGADWHVSLGNECVHSVKAPIIHNPKQRVTLILLGKV